MRVFVSMLMLCFLPVVALAQGGEYVPYSAEGYAFAVNLPNGGTVAHKGSEGWDRDAEVAFEWYGGSSDPVKLIMARVDDAQAALDDASFRAFTDELLSYWTPKRAAAGDAEGTDPPPAVSDFDVINTADNLMIGGRQWNLIEVKATTDKKTTVYYSVFSTWDGSKIYTMTFYYLQPTMEQVQVFGKPVLQGFQIQR